jgi:hypothetical protein
LEEVQLSPKDNGVLESICIRPSTSERMELRRCRLSPDSGTEGDRWKTECWLKRSDGSPDPDVQICIMNSRMIQLLAGDRDRWSLAGDNLFVDLDLSQENLVAGQKLRIGECVIEITAQPHNGCGKFKDRYGASALHVVNSPVGKQRRLRGIYAKVIEAGFVNVGDRITKV